MITVDVDLTSLTAGLTELQQKQIPFAVAGTVLGRLHAGCDVILDFTDTRYVDSSGLGVLLSITRQACELGMRVALVGISEDLQVLFELTRTDELLNIAESVDAAMVFLTVTPR